MSPDGGVSPEVIEDILLDTAEAFLPLTEGHRYKGARGGRGSAKSHFVAETLVADCFDAHQRILCTREFQASIGASSKQLIEDKISKFKVRPLFKITDTEIRGPNDSLFVFKGLHGHTAESIKSFEGFTRLWVEEAQTISQNSLDLVTPTFRQQPGKPKPQMYFTWNPKLAKNPVDKMFREAVEDKDPNYVCVTVNYRDNPWFPEDLRADMERDLRRDKDKHAHIWLGGYEQKSEARVFHNWRVEAFDTPDDARFFFGADWGFSIDPTVLVRCWIDHKKMRMYIDYEAYKIGCRIEDTPKLFDLIPQSRKWPIRADSARPETIDYMKRHGFPRLEAAEKGPNSVVDGIEFLKNYDISIHPRCIHTADEFAFYKYKVDKKTNEILPQLDDKKNHVIDANRYAVESLRKSKSVIVTQEFATALEAYTRSSQSSAGANIPASRQTFQSGKLPAIRRIMR